MSRAIMSPIRTYTPPSGLSRSTATYFSQSSSLLPPSSLPSWSLDHSCTTFRVGAATTATAAATKTKTTSATTAKHPRSARLIDDDPNREEEDHIRGIKRNRRTAMVLSPTTPWKRRCYPTALPFFLGSSNNNTAKHGNEEITTDFVSSSVNTHERTHGNIDTAFLLSQGFLTKARTPYTSSSSFDPTSREEEDSRHYFRDSYSKKDRLPECGIIDNDDDDEVTKGPPKFLRRSTIRDSFDLACTIEEFAQNSQIIS